MSGSVFVYDEERRWWTKEERVNTPGHWARIETERKDAPIIIGRSFDYYLDPPHFVYHRWESEPAPDPVQRDVNRRMERAKKGRPL